MRKSNLTDITEKKVVQVFKNKHYNYASEVIAGKQFMVVYSIETGF